MAFRKQKTQTAPKTVDLELAAKAFAKAIADGDVVNFRLLFAAFSPARVSSTERFESEKYEYLLPKPDEEESPAFKAALAAVKEMFTWKHILAELAANRPAQMPWNLLMMLGDNALRLGKHTFASQAYEQLRVRQRIQNIILEEADKALEEGHTAQAAHNFIVASELDYDYAAFPEPLPIAPDFQTHALTLHGAYPERFEDCIGAQPPEQFLSRACGYLLLGSDVAGRLDERPLEIRVAVFKELVRLRDPNWGEFVERYRAARELARTFSERFNRAIQERASGGLTLQSEIEKALGDDPRRIPQELLGHEIPEGEWWQYLKELAYLHPPAPLFLARQAVGELEILVPRVREDSPAADVLRLTAGVSP